MPQPADLLDDIDPADDPVVRAPKSMVALPEPVSYPRQLLLSTAGVGLTLGALLGVAGLAIVVAMRGQGLHSIGGGTAASVHAAPVTPRADGVRAEAPTMPLALTASDEPSAAESASRFDETHQRLGRGRTLPAVLRALGLSSMMATSVVRALRPLVNMRTLRPSDAVAVFREREAAAEIRRIEFRRSETQVWVVTVTPEQLLRAERLDIVRSSEPRAVAFVVRDALETTLRAARLHAEIVPRLQETFAAVGLPRELHRGDALGLVVEEDRLNGAFSSYGRIVALEYRGASGYRRAYFVRLSGHDGDYFDREGMTRDRGPLFAPVQPPRVTSPFDLHRRHPILHRIVPHLGIDFGAPAGAPVYAAAEGTVLTVTTQGPTGNLVRLRHPALGVETGYAHLSRFAPGVQPGAAVAVHQILGYVGSTGRSTGPHLHFSLKRGERFVDPMSLYGGRRPVPASRRAEFDQVVAQYGPELDAICPHADAATASAVRAEPERMGPTEIDSVPDDEGIATE